MKRPALLVATAACLLLAAPINAYSQGNMGGPPPGGSPPGASQGQPQDPQMAAAHKAEQELELKDRKSEMELKITNQMAELEKSKACIEAATSMEVLHSCMPRGGRGMMMGGPGSGMQGGPMMGGPEGGMQGGQGGGMRPPPPGGMGGQGPQ